MQTTQKRQMLRKAMGQGGKRSFSSGPTAEQRARINKITGNKPIEIADGTTPMDALKGMNPLLAAGRAYKKYVDDPIVDPAIAAVKKGKNAIDKNIVSPTANALRSIVKKFKK